jgi:hypothetical protein
MLDALKNLFENNVISEEIRAEIEAAWENRIQENKDTVRSELREEFAQKYEHDKSLMIEAIDQMVSDRLESEIKEFADDRKQLAEAKAKYHVAIREHSDMLDEFLKESLAKEIAELHEDQKVMADNFSKLEEFVVESLAKEISEFAQDKKDLAETKVRLVREAKDKFAEIKSRFVEKSAKIVEATVTDTLSREIGALKEDIDAARRHDFGRKIFEAFANEYQHSYVNEKSEAAKLMKALHEKEEQLAEAQKAITDKQRIVESKEQEIARAKDDAKRVVVMNELMNPLSAKQKEIMNELLEGVQTDKLEGTFNKYLPTVLEGNTTSNRKALTEGTEVTGNKENTKQFSSADAVSNVLDIRRLAGIN